MKRRWKNSLSGRNKGKEKRVRLRSLKNCISTVLMRRSRVQKDAAEEYDKNLVELKSAHEMILRSAKAYLRERKFI